MQVSRAFTTSMEVGTSVEVEDPNTGLKQRVCRAYFTYVAQSMQGGKQPLPPVYPSTPVELKEFLLASERRRGRLTRKASHKYYNILCLLTKCFSFEKYLYFYTFTSSVILTIGMSIYSRTRL